MPSDDSLKLKEANQKISELISELKEAKEKEEKFESEIRNLKAEIKYLEANKKNLEILSEKINFLEEERKNLESKLELKEEKIEELLQDKESLLKEKSETFEVKNEIFQKLTKKEIEIQQKDQKIESLREKFKQSSGDLLSKSMEIDKLLKKVKTMENNEESKKKDGEISLENTRILTDIETIIEYIKIMLPQCKTNVRLVIPDIDDLNKFEITTIIKEIPNKIRLNIATKIDDPGGNEFVNEIKKYCQLTNYFERKFIALNIDSSIFLVGIFKGDNVIGIYTDILEIIELFKPAIMEPFVKGRRV